MFQSKGIYPGRFNNKVAIITGGASGSGKAVAKRIAEEGGRVVLWDLNEKDLLLAQQETRADFIVPVDVSDHEAVAMAAEISHGEMSKVDLLVCSAGVTGPVAPVEEYPVEGWLKVINVNLNGIFYCCRAVVPYLVANGYGRIVNLSSVAGKEGNPNASAYSASKAGVLAFTKSLGKELAGSGVLVNAVTPAVFNSPLLSQMPDSQIEFMKSRIPMGRLGEVDEVTAMICWLLSEECSFSTAATFDISGGRTTY